MLPVDDTRIIFLVMLLRIKRPREVFHELLNQLIGDGAVNEDVVWRDTCLSRICQFAECQSLGCFLDVGALVNDDGRSTT